jgi:hypothetical protein
MVEFNSLKRLLLNVLPPHVWFEYATPLFAKLRVRRSPFGHGLPNTLGRSRRSSGRRVNWVELVMGDDLG